MFKACQWNFKHFWRFSCKIQTPLFVFGLTVIRHDYCSLAPILFQNSYSIRSDLWSPFFKNVLGSRKRTERVSPNYVIIMTIAIACVGWRTQVIISILFALVDLKIQNGNVGIIQPAASVDAIFWTHEDICDSCFKKRRRKNSG